MLTECFGPVCLPPLDSADSVALAGGVRVGRQEEQEEDEARAR